MDAAGKKWAGQVFLLQHLNKIVLRDTDVAVEKAKILHLVLATKCAGDFTWEMFGQSQKNGKRK